MFRFVTSLAVISAYIIGFAFLFFSCLVMTGTAIILSKTNERFVSFRNLVQSEFPVSSPTFAAFYSETKAGEKKTRMFG